MDLSDAWASEQKTAKQIVQIKGTKTARGLGSIVLVDNIGF